MYRCLSDKIAETLRGELAEGLQNLPRPTRDGPAFFVRGDIDFDRLEIAKVK